MSKPQEPDPATRRAMRRFLDAAARTADAAEEMRRAKEALDRAAERSARGVSLSLTPPAEPDSGEGRDG